jgi:hypothetical protein
MLHPQTENTEKGLQMWRIAANMFNKQDEMAEALVRMGEKRNAYQIFMENPEGRTQLGKHKWEDNIKMDHLYCFRSLVCQLRRFNLAINTTLL